MTANPAHAVPLSLAELVEWTNCVADAVRAGLYDVRADADQGTQLHGERPVCLSWRAQRGSSGVFIDVR